MAIKQLDHLETVGEEIGVAQIVAAQPTAKLVRLRQARDTAREQELSRRRWGALVMAAVSVAALTFRRIGYESATFIAVEGLICLACLLTAGWLQGVLFLPGRSLRVGHKRAVTEKKGQSWRPTIWVEVLVVMAILFPWMIAAIGRNFGFGNSPEIIMLESLAWGGVAAAAVGIERRTVSLSVICSGFLTLFITFISDSQQATWFACAWGMLCMWWLVANHWEQVESTAAVDVLPARLQRYSYLIVGSVAFAVGAGAIANRVPVLRKMQAEVMPTSGGTSQKDSMARSGVGNGDALIAAKNHASSFGAVETDMFLDSEKPSLFDMFSDEFGEPKKMERVEQAQALSPSETSSNDGKFAEANRASGGDEFSVEREKPKEQQTLDDLASAALMFWEGEAGAHLVVQRFTDFDGDVWLNSPATPGQRRASLSDIEPKSIELDGRTWMQPKHRTVQNSISPFVGALPEAIKFTRYSSPIIPTRAGVQLWSIDQLTRSDFFAFSASECLSMPGRDHVPDYTVVRMINSRIDMLRMQDLLSHCAPGRSHTELKPACQQSLNQLAHEFAGENPRGWPEVRSIIDGLRRRFKHERSPAAKEVAGDISQDSALEHFLQCKQGPSYLFATSAALMLKHLGYETRFVTGFYANPKHYLARDREYAIQPSDAHTWIEIHAGHGYWIPLEPSPGFRAPRYSASLWYRLNEARVTILLALASLVALATLLYCVRRTLLEVLAIILLPLVRLLDDRQRIGWLAWVLDQRLRMAGQPRKLGVTPRSKLKKLQGGLPGGLGNQLEEILMAADRITFAPGATLSNAERATLVRVWREVTVRVLRHGPPAVQSETT